jgi:hypothetical protein
MNLETLDPQTKTFIRRSETESICTFCSRIIQTDQYAPLEKVEDIHADVCLGRRDSPTSYAL